MFHSYEMSQVSVVVADAQRLFCEVVADALSEHDLLVLEPRPRSAGELLEALEAGQPDVVLVDFYLDVTPPEELLAAIGTRAPHAKVVFLSWLHRPEDVRRVLAAGAVGYLPKTCEVETVVEAVGRAHAGEYPVFGEQLNQLLGRLEERREMAGQVDQRMRKLTPRELEVLGWLAVGYTRKGVAAALGVRPDTVRTHMMNIKAKTGARTQLEAVRMAEGEAALRLPDDRPG